MDGWIVLKSEKLPGQLEAGQPPVEAELPRLNTATIDTFVLARGAWLFKPPDASSRYMYEPGQVVIPMGYGDTYCPT